jgi:hypothetical protein
MKLTTREIRLLALLSSPERLDGNEIETVERFSDREFDLKITGQRYYAGGVGPAGFSARLDLWTINVLLDWTKPNVANLSDYPTMAKGGRLVRHPRQFRIVHRRHVPTRPPSRRSLTWDPSRSPSCRRNSSSTTSR